MGVKGGDEFLELLLVFFLGLGGSLIGRSRFIGFALGLGVFLTGQRITRSIPIRNDMYIFAMY